MNKGAVQCPPSDSHKPEATGPSTAAVNGRGLTERLLYWLSQYFMTIDSVCFAIEPDSCVITLSQQTLKWRIGFIFSFVFFLPVPPLGPCDWQHDGNVFVREDCFQ